MKTTYTIRKLWYFYACALILWDFISSLSRLIPTFDAGRPDTLLLVHTLAVLGAMIGMVGLSTTDAVKQNVFGREAK